MSEEQFTHVIIVGRELRGKAVVHYNTGDRCFCTYQFEDDEEVVRGFIPSGYLVEVRIFLHLFRVGRDCIVMERERIP